MEYGQPGNPGQSGQPGQPGGAASWQIGPRSAGKILDLAFNLYFGNITRLLMASAVIVIPLTILSIVIYVIAFGEPSASDELGLVEIGDDFRRVNYDVYNTLTILNGIISILGYLVIVGASYTAANNAYLGREVIVSESVRPAINKLHSILWVSIITVIAVVIGVFALLVGAIYAAVMLAVAIPVLMVEDVRGFKACRRSFNLIKGNFWRTLGVLFVAAIFTGLFQLIAGLVGEAATGLAEDQINLWIVIVQIVSAIALAFTASFTAVVTVVLYYDARIRNEGYDIEQLASGLDDGGEGAGTGAAEFPSSQQPPPPPPPASGS